jgi:hypothetical protein
MSNYAKVARIELTGETTEDLLIALDEVRKKISDEFIAGSDFNDSGSYDFSVTHELQSPVK